MIQIPRDYQPPADLLRDRVVLVTGAGAGIGRAVSRAYAAHGATVVLLGRTIARLESVYDEIVAAGDPQPAIYPMDLAGAQPNDHEELCERIASELGHLDGLLHNAALLGSLSPLEHYELDQWQQVVQVNLNAVFLLTRTCLGLLKRAPDASVIFTSSGVGRHGRAYWGAYCVSKFAVEGMMQVLADELAANTRVRVNSLSPGAVRTAMRAAAYPAEDTSRLAAPEDVVGAYLYLMGPDSAGCHGQSLDAQ